MALWGCIGGQPKPGLSLVSELLELLLKPDQVVDRAQSWIMGKGLDPDWRNWVVGLCLTIPKGLVCEPVHVELPVVLNNLHFAKVCKGLTQTTATKKAVLIMSLLRGSSFVSPQLVKRINTVF